MPQTRKARLGVVKRRITGHDGHQACPGGGAIALALVHAGQVVLDARARTIGQARDAKGLLEPLDGPSRIALLQVAQTQHPQRLGAHGRRARSDLELLDGLAVLLHLLECDTEVEVGAGVVGAQVAQLSAVDAARVDGLTEKATQGLISGHLIGTQAVELSAPSHHIHLPCVASLGLEEQLFGIVEQVVLEKEVDLLK